MRTIIWKALLSSAEASLGSLSNDDGDGNENGKTEIGLNLQNNNFARASRFLYISLPSLHDYNVIVPNGLHFHPSDNPSDCIRVLSRSPEHIMWLI